MTMKNANLLSLLAATMMLAGCGGAGEAEKATAAPVESAESAAPANAGAPAGEWRRITISAYTCGDNCYLEYTVGDNVEPEGAICNAAQCTPWFEAQAIPQSELGRSYEVRMGTTDQVDGAGNVMASDYPAIIEMRPVG
jgi:hypothetical protein